MLVKTRAYLASGWEHPGKEGNAAFAPKAVQCDAYASNNPIRYRHEVVWEKKWFLGIFTALSKKNM